MTRVLAAGFTALWQRVAERVVPAEALRLAWRRPLTVADVDAILREHYRPQMMAVLDGVFPRPRCATCGRAKVLDGAGWFCVDCEPF